MRFEAARSKSVLMTGGITIANEVLPTSEIQPLSKRLRQVQLTR